MTGDNKALPSALPQEHWTVQALIVAINALTKAGNDLAFKAETSCGVAGRDEPLCDAIAHWAAERDKFRQVIRIVKFEGHDPEIGAGVLAMDPAGHELCCRVSGLVGGDVFSFVFQSLPEMRAFLQAAREIQGVLVTDIVEQPFSTAESAIRDVIEDSELAEKTHA